MVRVCASMYRFSIGSLLEILVANSIEKHSENDLSICRFTGNLKTKEAVSLV